MEIIYALSTATGKSGVAVIRISGNDLEALRKSLKIKDLEDRYATLSSIYHPVTSELIDKAIIIYFKSPNSFTGEDIIELHIHGSRALISRTLDALSLIKNTRIAEPGEFSKRAFLNNKMDLCEAEGLEDLINSETKAQAMQALRQISGNLSNLYNSWREKIIRSLALIEAYIDFPDDEIPGDVIIEIQQNINILKGEIQSHLNDNQIGQKIRDGIYITIIGEPNVGKSSLLNLLAKRDVAIVSDIPGTTRDVIEVDLDIMGVHFTIADTAGIRNTSDFIEQKGIDRAKDAAKKSDYKIAIFDATDLPHINKFIWDLVDDNTIILFNKIDRVQDFNEPDQNKNSIGISVRENIGIDKLIEKLKEIAKELSSQSSNPYITRVRYRENLTRALEALNLFSFDLDIEIAAEELRASAEFISKITGKIDVETILDEIFSSFCIGK